MLKKSENTFYGNVKTLSKGVFFAQAMSLLSTPILTRLFEPEHFGIAATFVSLLLIVKVFTCYQYEHAIVTCPTDRVALSLVALSLLIAVFNTLILALFILVADPWLATVAVYNEIGAFIWLIPVGNMLHGIRLALNYHFTRHKIFSSLSFSTIINQFSYSLSALSFGMFGLVSSGFLILASMLSLASSILPLIYKSVRIGAVQSILNVKTENILCAAREYKNFPIYTPWATFFNTLSWQAPIFFIGIFFSPLLVGLYAIGFRLLQIPMNLIGKPISRVFLSYAGEADKSGQLGFLVEGLIKRLFLIISLPSLILMLYAPEFFGIIFGEKWLPSGEILQILLPWGIVWFISSPLGALFYVFGLQKKEVYRQFVILVFRVLSMIIGGYLLKDFNITLILLSVSGVLFYMHLIFTLVNLSKADYGTILKSVFKIGAEAAVWVIPIIVIDNFLDHPVVTLFMSALVIVAFLLKKRDEIFSDGF